MSESEKKAWFRNYTCGQCHYLKGYSRNHVTCEDKYDKTENSEACASFTLKEKVHTCQQCVWLDQKSRGRNCRERGYDEYTKACWQYTQAPRGYTQVNGRVMIDGFVANTFELETTESHVPFVIKQGNRGLLITAIPNKNGSPTYVVKPISLDKDGTAVLEEPELGTIRPEFAGRPSAVSDEHGLVGIKFVHGKLTDSSISSMSSFLSESEDDEDHEDHDSIDLDIDALVDIVEKMPGVLEKNILKLVGNYGIKLKWDAEFRQEMVEKIRTRYDERSGNVE